MLSLALRASELLFGIAPKSSQKGLAPDAVVWFASGEPNFPALLARAGLLRQYIRVLLRQRGDPSPRPFGQFRPQLRCSAPRTAPVSTNPSIHGLRRSRRSSPLQICRKSKTSERLLLRQDAAQPGPRKARRRRAGKSPQGTAHDARSFAAVHGRTVSEPPERLCAPAGQATAWMPEVEQRRSSCRMPGGRAFPGCAFFGYFLCTSKESDPLGRRPSGSLALDRQATGFRLSPE